MSDVLGVLERKVEASGMNCLTDEEADFYVIYWLVAEVASGGMDRYLYYDAGRYAERAIVGLSRWGEEWCSRLVVTAINVLPTPFPHELKPRQLAMDSLSHSKNTLLDEVTNQMLVILDELREKLESIEGNLTQSYLQ